MTDSEIIAQLTHDREIRNKWRRLTKEQRRTARQNMPERPDREAILRSIRAAKQEH